MTTNRNYRIDTGKPSQALDLGKITKTGNIMLIEAYLKKYNVTTNLFNVNIYISMAYDAIVNGDLNLLKHCVKSGAITPWTHLISARRRGNTHIIAYLETLTYDVRGDMIKGSDIK